MKTEAIEELIEHCKHIGGIPAMFLKERIIAAEEELKSIKAAQQNVQRTGGESGQQNLFSAGEVLPAKVTRQSTLR